MPLEWDTQEWRRERDKRLLHWLKDEWAVDALLKLSHIAEIWDDLIDKDREVTQREVNDAFVAAMVKLEVNPFFQAHRNTIMPVVWISINAWMDSEDLVKSGRRDAKMLAFYLRNYSCELVQIIAMCAIGWDGLRAISLEMRQFFTHESYFDWEHRHASEPFLAA